MLIRKMMQNSQESCNNTVRKGREGEREREEEEKEGEEEKGERSHLLTSSTGVQFRPSPDIPFGQGPHWNSVSDSFVHSISALKHG